jgi:hypothetical protein
MATMVQEIGYPVTATAPAIPIEQDEALEIFDRAARYFLNMSGPEFLDAWSAHRFGDDPDTVPGVMEVASLIPLLARR